MLEAIANKLSIILLKAKCTAPQDARIASGHEGLVGYLYQPDSGTHNLKAPVGIQS